MTMSTSEDWRTIQIFLCDKTLMIFEVEMESESRLLRCNCPAFLDRESCKHTKFVSRRMTGKNHYKVTIPDTVEEDELQELTRSPEKFRQFILKYGKVEVI